MLPRISGAVRPGPELEAAAEQPTMRLGHPSARLPQPGSPEEPVGTAAGNSAIMAIGSLVSRGTGFLRTMIITAALGNVIGNLYTTAQIFPGMIYEFLLGGVLTSVVVPVLVRARTRDADGGDAYAQRLLTLTAASLGGAALLATLMAPLLTLIYASGAPAADRSVITVLSYLILPTIFFYGLSAVMSALLNSRGSFAAPMWTPILNNTVVIATFVLYIVLFGGSGELRPGDLTPAQIAVMGGGTLLGIAVQAVGLFPALRRAGFHWRWRWDLRALGLRELGHLGGWMFCYVAVSQLGLLVMINLITRVKNDAVGIMTYNNVFLLMMMAHGIIAVSIITALMPRMSAASARGRNSDIVSDLAKGVRSTIAMLAPVVITFVVIPEPIMITLFAHGRYTVTDAVAGARVLFIAGLALVPFSISQLLTFAFYALPDTKTPALLNLPVVAVRVISQIALFATLALSLTAAGMMLGNAISYVAAAGLSIWFLRKRLGPLGLTRTVGTIGRVGAAAAAAGALGWACVAALRSVGVSSSLVQLFLGGAVIVGAYIVAAMLLRVSEINDVLALIGRVRRKVLRR
jgi:putative peptidoglycan lipid II flippase